MFGTTGATSAGGVYPQIPNPTSAPADKGLPGPGAGQPWNPMSLLSFMQRPAQGPQLLPNLRQASTTLTPPGNQGPRPKQKVAAGKPAETNPQANPQVGRAMLNVGEPGPTAGYGGFPGQQSYFQNPYASPGSSLRNLLEFYSRGGAPY